MKLLFDQRHDDLDCVRADVRDWDLDFRLIGRGGFRSRIRQLASRGVLVSYAGFECRLHQQGSTPAGFRTFAIPEESCGEFWWRGFNATHQHLLIFPKSNELDSASRRDFAVYVVSVHEDDLERIAENLGLAGPSAAAQVLRPTRSSMLDLRQTARWAVFTPQAAGRRMAAAMLVEKILCVTSSGQALRKPRARQRDLAIRRVIDHLSGANLPPLELAVLCEIARVSERTLQYAFKARFGASPHQFTIQWRLNSARRELLAAGPAGHTIAQVARRYGFDNPSLFAHRYKELFAELPSETLVRSDRRCPPRPKTA